MESNSGNSDGKDAETTETDEHIRLTSDLQQVEETLLAPAAAGRAITDSVRSSLISIRNRLSSLVDESSRQLMERLEVAERSHSSRVPLSIMRERFRHPNQRQLSEPQLPPHRSISVEDHSTSTGWLRRASNLSVSRVRDQKAQGSQVDRDFHGSISISTIQHVLLEDDEDSEKESDDDDNDKMEIEPEESIELVFEETVVALHPEVPILLTRHSKTSLDPRRRSVLFSSVSLVAPLDDEDLETQQMETIEKEEPLKSDVYSWGTFVGDVLEDGSEAQEKPTALATNTRLGRSNIVSMDIGPSHMVVATPSSLFVMGDNRRGACNPAIVASEVQIPRLTVMESISAQILQVSCGTDHTVVIAQGGSALSWGSNSRGQLGHRSSNGQADARPPTAMVLKGARATQVACGDGFTLLLTSRMGLMACGVDEICGYRPEENFLPAQIPALANLPLVYVAAGKQHAMALTAHGSVFGWGRNDFGQLGREYPLVAATPKPVRITSGLSNMSSLSAPLSSWGHFDESLSIADDAAIVDVSCGDRHTLFISRSGRVLRCGDNGQGQLETTSSTSIKSVQPLPIAKKITQTTTGSCHSLLLDENGDVWFLGRGAEQPEMVLGGKSADLIIAGGCQSLVVANPGREMRKYLHSSRESDNFSASLEDLVHSLETENDTESSSACESLTTSTEELFRSPSVLNSLFVDPKEMNEFYQKLASIPNNSHRQRVYMSLQKAIQTGLEICQSHGARLMYPEQIRFLLLYLQCPFFVEHSKDDVFFDKRGDAILYLCETILSLPYEGYRALMVWATSVYTGEMFAEYLIRPLVAQLNKALLVEAGAERRPIAAVAGVLNWFYKAAEQSGFALASREAFCLGSLSKLSPEYVVGDLIRHKAASVEQRRSSFFLCQNPWLFSPQEKRMLLQFENEINMYKTAASTATYDEEEQAFTMKPFFVLEIERENLLRQTLSKLRVAEPEDLRKKLRIQFKGEEGIDAGGVAREFFQLLSAQLFDVNNGMWTTRFNSDEPVTWFNESCIWKDDEFFLVGVLVGLALYNDVLIDAHFPPALYRKLLGATIGLEDMVDPTVRSGLQQLLDYEDDDVEDVFCLSFSVTWSDLGEEKVKELKPGGEDMPVTSANKEEYVLLYVKWLLVDSIYPQYEAFERGFMRVMEDTSLEILRPEDLELLVVGTPELDFQALEDNAEYEGGYDKDSIVVQNLWKYVKNSDKEKQLMFLKFSTGSSKAPIGGLGCLSFKVQRAGPDSFQLPSSHTCFNTLLLPDYGDNYEKLEERLGRAVVECEGFGLQ